MESEELFLTRHTPPTRFDYAPLGTICYVNDDANKFYMQISEDEEYAEWMTMGNVLMELFEPYMDNKDFIAKIKKLFFDGNYEFLDFLIISKIDNL